MADSADPIEAKNEEEELKLINEEYKIWKKNTPFLYDLVLTHALVWPSLTVEWLSRKHTVANKDYSEHSLILGTHTSGAEQNYLMMAKVKLPNDDTVIDARKYDEEKGELGSYGGATSKVEITVRINHDGEVNRARCMPQDELVVATKTVTGEVCIFDISKHESTPSTDGVAKPNIRCKGHDKEGYGIDWNKLTKGHLLSGGDDGIVCIWDIESKPDKTSSINPLTSFTAHTGVVDDVQWHRHTAELYGSVGDDQMLYIWDTRSDKKEAAHSVHAHNAEINSLSFSPFNQYLLLTASSDKTAKLWDMRKMGKSLHTFEGHQDEVLQVMWAPFSEAVMATCGEDRRVLVWDLSRIGREQAPEDAEDGPPELLFIHGGHTSKVSDFSWNKSDDWIMASVAEDNILQIWQMAENIYVEEQPQEDVKNVRDEDLE